MSGLSRVVSLTSANDVGPRHKCDCNRSSPRIAGVCTTCLIERASGGCDGEMTDAAFDEALASADVPQGLERMGNFDLLEEIGRGGMGVIYRARDRRSERIVAVKRALSYHADSPESLARFRREAATAASLDHPHILPVYEIGDTADGLPFFAMKFATGGSLREIASELRGHVSDAVALIEKVARAAQHAHDRGIIHRDLKPANILLDARCQPMVTDFGLAKWIDATSDITRTLTIFGTAGYIAPEQASAPAALLTPAADVYSLGAILFELLTGRPPFEGPHAFAVMQQARECPAPGLRAIEPSLDRNLESICARCLELDPRLRYGDAGELADDLERWRERRPIRARRTPWLTRASRWAHRNRAIAAGLVTVALLSAATVGWNIHRDRLTRAAADALLASQSIVVLPFLDLDRCMADEDGARLFAATLQQQLNVAGPARVSLAPGGTRSLLAIGTGDQLKSAARATNARAALSGTTRAIAGGRRTAIHLIDPVTGAALLTREWDAPGSMPAEVAAAIHAMLDTPDWSSLPDSSADPGLANAESRDEIVAARALTLRYDVADIDRAIALLRKALAAESTSAVAHAYLALAASDRTHFSAEDRFLELAETEARRALELSPGLGDAHRALAGVLYQQGNFTDASEEQMRTVEIAGLEERTLRLIAMTQDMLGRPDRALAWYRLARAGESQPGDTDASIGDMLMRLGHDDAAEQSYRRAEELRPNLPRGWVGRCHLRILRGDLAGASEVWRSHSPQHDGFVESQWIAAQLDFYARDFAAAAERYEALAASDPGGGGDFYGALDYRSALGRCLQARGDQNRASGILHDALAEEAACVAREPANPEALYRLAGIQSSLGQQEPALATLRSAFAAGWTDYRSLELDPRFDGIREQPAYAAIVAEMTHRIGQLRDDLRGQIGVLD